MIKFCINLCICNVFFGFICTNVIQIRVSINIFKLKRFGESNLKFIAQQNKTDEDRWGGVWPWERKAVNECLGLIG